MSGTAWFTEARYGEVTTSRPNIVFLQCDQFRHDALGVARPWVVTPNLDALARRGIRFAQATCTVPMCIPSRYSMMLGLYGSQSGVRHNSNMIPSDDGLPVPTLAQRLRALGYRTGGFGKTHWYTNFLKGTRHVDIRASTRGFERRALQYPRASTNAEPDAVYYDEQKPACAQQLEDEARTMGSGGENACGYTGCSSAVSGADQPAAWLTEQALSFLGEQAGGSDPFFLYLSFDAPHPGLIVPPGYEELYAMDDVPLPGDAGDIPRSAEHIAMLRHTADWAAAWSRLDREGKKTCLRRYYALCTYADAQFGRVVEAIQRQGLLDRTFFVFTSDHGDSLGDRGRFGKFSLYEAAVRVPLILAGAGVSTDKANTTDSRPASLVDVAPTVLAVAGTRVPAILPGENLLCAPARPGAFAEMHGVGCEALQRAPAYMWRAYPYKLTLHFPGALRDMNARLTDVRGELYDLAADPDERKNLYDDRAWLAIRERLTRELLMHLAGAWARYPLRPGGPLLAPDEANG